MGGGFGLNVIFAYLFAPVISIGIFVYFASDENTDAAMGVMALNLLARVFWNAEGVCAILTILFVMLAIGTLISESKKDGAVGPPVIRQELTAYPESL